MKPIIVANWKMNPSTRAEADVLFRAVQKGLSGEKRADVVICPSFVHLDVVSGRSRIMAGAQDVFWEDRGAFTGEISPMMLKKHGVTHVIIGHSERRTFLGETDEMINLKLKAASRSGLIPILCIGETERKKAGSTPLFIESQMRRSLKGLRGKNFKNGIIAYEPVWAIGTGTPETPEGATRVAAFIRNVLADLFDRKTCNTIRILYGGSVNAGNAASFMRDGGMEGVLVGGVSLKPAEFIRLVKSIR